MSRRARLGCGQYVVIGAIALMGLGRCGLNNAPSPPPSAGTAPTPPPAPPSPEQIERARKDAAEEAAHEARMNAAMEAKARREAAEVAEHERQAKDERDAAEARAAFAELRGNTYQGQLAAEQAAQAAQRQYVEDHYRVRPASSGRRTGVGRGVRRPDPRNKVNGGPGRGRRR